MPLSNYPLCREPKLVSQSHYCVLGDVTVDTTAAIAPGVVLQASPGSRLVIGPGACLSAGVCVQSRQGVLTIGAGVTLGANVLIVGAGTVGDRACISPGSTLLNPDIAAETVVAPGDIVGAIAPSPTHSPSHSSAPPSSSPSFQAATPLADTHYSSQTHTQTTAQNGQHASQPPSSSSNGYVHSNGYRPGGPNTVDISQMELGGQPFVDPGPIGPKPVTTPSLSDQAGGGGFESSRGSHGDVAAASGQHGIQTGFQSNSVQSSYGGSNPSMSSTGGPASGDHSSAVQPSVGGALTTNTDRVYGRDQVSQLLSTLFPHRQSLNSEDTSR